jgi:hypothetical protein
MRGERPEIQQRDAPRVRDLVRHVAGARAALLAGDRERELEGERRQAHAVDAAGGGGTVEDPALAIDGAILGSVVNDGGPVAAEAMSPTARALAEGAATRAVAAAKLASAKPETRRRLRDPPDETAAPMLPSSPISRQDPPGMQEPRIAPEPRLHPDGVMVHRLFTFLLG